MKVAVIGSNYVNIDRETQKGTEIFSYSLVTSLAAAAKAHDLDITLFASGASKLPVTVESIDLHPSSTYENIHEYNKHFIFELALISKAVSQQNNFDVYHMNIGDGDLIMPFAPSINKPIIITLHRIIDEEFTRKYFALFKDLKHVYFISASDAQRQALPDVNYLTTIYHGIDTEIFQFSPMGGNSIMWAGRAIPRKGPDAVVAVAKDFKKETNLFGIPKKEHQEWFESQVLNTIETNQHIRFISGKSRYELIPHFQQSKLFLFPSMEEAFGLVLTEAMSCGTPVIAYGIGSIPEIIKDGVTGFIVSPSDSDSRGNWTIKKTGIDGLKEAVQRIYSLPEEEYIAMRKACREHVQNYFTIEKMVEKYIDAYKKVIRTIL